MNAHLREPFRGVNLWAPRFVYLAGGCVAFAFLFFKSIEIDIALIIFMPIYCIVFETIVHVYWSRRANVWSQGERIEATVLSKKTTPKSATSMLVIEYVINGENVQAEGVVPDRLYFSIREKERLFVRVVKSKPKRWVLDGNDESYY